MAHWDEAGAGGEARRGARLLRRRAEVTLRELPDVLEHGDCHAENIVRDDCGRYRWIDWQQARLGKGLDDLVFLWQRAEFAGASPPRQEMLAAYAAARAMDLSVLAPLGDRSELRLLVHRRPRRVGRSTPGVLRHCR